MRQINKESRTRNQELRTKKYQESSIKTPRWKKIKEQRAKNKDLGISYNQTALFILFLYFTVQHNTLYLRTKANYQENLFWFLIPDT